MTMTVESVFEECWCGHWNTPRYHRSRHANNVHVSYEKHIAPIFGHRPLNSITAKDIRFWHRLMEPTPYAANRALEVFSKLFSFAQEMEIIEQGINPCQLVKAFTEKKRSRYASLEEIKTIATILEREKASHPREVAFIYLLMFSGSRPRALERATWGELKRTVHDSGHFGVLTFVGKSTASTGEEETVLLPPPAMRILDQLGDEQGDGKLLLGIKMPTHFWNKVKVEAGVKDLWARDWRRTFATLGFSSGIPVGIIGELLNHHSPATTKTYAKLINTARVDAVSKISKTLEDAIGR